MPYMPPQNLTAEAVAALPPPGTPLTTQCVHACAFASHRFTHLVCLPSLGLSGPSALEFSPKDSHNDGKSKYLVFVSTSTKASSSSTSRRLRTSVDPAIAAAAASSHERQLSILDLSTFQMQPLLKLPSKRRFDSEQQSSSSPSPSADILSLEERLRRERQRMHSSGGLTQFCWAYNNHNNVMRLLVPIRGSLYVQDGLDSYLKVVYDKHSLDHVVRSSKIVPPPPTSAIDPQMSPDCQLFAFCVLGEIFVAPCHECHPPVQLTYGADLRNCITHGLADFVAQEEMDRYRGFWWSPDSKGILFAQVNESTVPPYRITHHECETTSDSCMYEDHRYPFAGKSNPSVKLAYVQVDAASLLRQRRSGTTTVAAANNAELNSIDSADDPQAIAQTNWNSVKWFDPPREAQEYLARLDFLPDGSACAQWQNRTQNCLVLCRMDLTTGKSRTLLVERSDVWINLNHLLYVLDRPIHPKECRNTSIQPPLPDPLPKGSFSFLFGSERSGFCHLYLYTYVPGLNGEQAMLIRQISGGDWMVENIVGVSLAHNVVYVTGTFDSVLERHLYALPIFLPEEELDNNAMDTEHSSYSPGHPNGVRRGLKQVMNALSGKSHSSLNNSAHSHNSSQHNPAVINPTIPSSTLAAVKRSLSESPDIYAMAPLRLTAESGMHSVVMDPDCTKFVDTSSDLGRPTTVRIFEMPQSGPFSVIALNGRGNQQEHNSEGASTAGPKSRLLKVRLLYTLYDAVRDDKSMDLAPDSMAHLPAPELMTFPSSDGTETLHAALYRPDARIHGPGPYPLICAVYGGPHVQRVNKSWSQCADMRAQRLRSLGFCVVKCDNRGSSRRGLAFESAISRRLGRLEVLDQVAVVRQLTVRGIADPTRVGIYGWSYGGYLSAMCLCRAPDVFHVAVAGAPVTSWDGYDTHYTERYMGLPSENPNGYRESAAFDHVPNMRGKLLLVHGLIDENVHFRHTARLINRLIAAGKDYDLLLFPDERHSPRRLRDRIYMEQRISDYFLKHLSASSMGGTMRTMAGL
jgi:dienelactone hydrolase